MYTVLSPELLPVGSLTLKSGRGTKFWSDTITQQIADDGSNDDPATNLSMTANKLDKQANHKLWNHELVVSFDNDSLGGQVETGYYLLYFDEVAKKYYLMYVRQVDEDPEHMYRTATCSNASIFEMSGIKVPKFEFKQETLENIIKYIFKYVPWSASVVPNNLTMDYTIDGNTTAQSLIQELQVKFDVEVDAYVELNESGRINNRVVYIGRLGANNGALLRYGSASNGYENMTRTAVNDTLYTKLNVTGVTDEKDTNAGHIGSVNNGLEYIVDDEANLKYNPIGASQNPPVYREVTLENTLLKNPTALLDWLKEQMQLFNHPRYNYTVTALHDFIAGLGDIVSLQDTKAQPAIYITSRVIQITKSFASPETNTTTFGEFSSLNITNNKAVDAISIIKKEVTIAKNSANEAVNTAELAKQSADKANQAAQNASQKIDTTMATEKSRVDGLLDQQNTKIQSVVKEASDYTDSAKAEVLNHAQELAIEAENSAIAESNKVRDNLVKEIKDRNQAITDANTRSDTIVSNAKTDLTNSIAKETADRTKAINDANTKAQGFADQAKTDAISAATTADGKINKRIDDTADSINSTISQNKLDADGKISTVSSTANQALNGLSTKVSQTDYDKKTGDLSTKINDVKETADSSAQTIADIKIADGKQDTRMAEIENTASSLKTTVSDLQTAQGKQSADISTLQQRADGFESTVTKVNGLSVDGRNLFINSTSINAWVNGNGSTSSSNNDLTSDYISTVGQTNILVQTFDSTLLPKNTALAFYNPDKTFLSSGLPGSGKSVFTKISDNLYQTSVSIPSGAGYFRISFSGSTDKTKHKKVEFGTLYTDWTPAPEDTDTSISKAQQTADQASLNLSNYKTDADGRITKAQADIVTNANSIKTKVSIDTFNQKTGDLQTKYGQVNTKVDSVTTTVGDIKTKNDQQDSDISQVKITADSITNWVKDSNGNLSSSMMTALFNTTALKDFDKNSSVKSQTANMISSAVSDSENGMRSLISQKADSTVIGNILEDVNDLKKSNQWQRIAYDDINYLKQTGNYFITSGRGYNYPPNIRTWFYIKVYAPQDNRITQNVWQDLDTSEFYSRTFDGSNWSEWTQTVNSSTLLSIFNDQWSLGTYINTSIGQKIATGIAGLPDGTLSLTGKSIHLTGDTIVDGSFMTKALSTQEATIGKTLTLGSGGMLKSDIMNMTATSFDVDAPNVSAVRTSATKYKVNTSGHFLINSGLGNINAYGDISITTPDGNNTTSAKFYSEYNPNNIYLRTDGWSDNSLPEHLNISAANISIMKGGDGLRDNSNNYMVLSPFDLKGNGNIIVDGTVTSRNILLNGYHSIVSKDGGKMYMGTPRGLADLGVKSLTQSSLVSTKENIGNVDPEYALSEILKADVRQYNFRGDTTNNIHVTPMIDDVEGKMYIPKDWLSYEGDSVDTYTIIGYLVQSVKALQSQIDILKGK